MAGEPPLPPSGADRAALAFSILSARTADRVNRRLTVSERLRLRDALARTSNASDEERFAAVRLLARSVRRGMEWPRPSIHDDADCPFHVVLNHPTARVIDILERIAEREPLEVAVTLCHLPPEPRATLWNAMTSEAHAAVIPALDEVHGVSTTRTRAYARDINARLSRAIRTSSSPTVRGATLVPGGKTSN
jgi:hypothetical protein